MRRTSGQLAYLAALGGGFLPAEDSVFGGTDRGDGTYLTPMTHADGRTLAITTRRGDGWQRGRFVQAVAGGPWTVPPGGREVTVWWGVRVLLASHEPGREEPYCGGKPIRQARRLDGQERDILCRILRDIENACRDPERQEALLRVICLHRAEAFRLVEMQAVLDPRP